MSGKLSKRGLKLLLMNKQEALTELFRRSPLHGVTLDLERRKYAVR